MSDFNYDIGDRFEETVIETNRLITEAAAICAKRFDDDVNAVERILSVAQIMATRISAKEMCNSIKYGEPGEKILDDSRFL